MNWGAIWVLARADIASHRGRLIAACIATGMAASILLGALMGLRAVHAKAPIAAEQTFAANEVHLVATSPTHHMLDGTLLAAVAADPRVAAIDLCRDTGGLFMPATEAKDFDRATFYATGPRARWAGWIPSGNLRIAAWTGDDHHARLAAGRWPDPDALDPIELAVPDRGLPMPMVLGSWWRVESDGGVTYATVVGVIATGSGFTMTPFARRLPQIQAAPRAIERLAGRAVEPADARIRLRDAASSAAFVADWRQRCTDLPGRPELWDRATIATAAATGWAMVSAQSAVRTAVLLAATCVLALAWAVQGASVRERSAQFTVLHALGAGRGTIFLSVVTAAMPIALGGLVVAVILAWGAKVGFMALMPMVPLERGPPDAASVALTAAVVVLGALAGATRPAWVAMRAGRAVDDDARTARACLMIAALASAAIAAAILATPSGTVARAQALGWLGIPGLGLAALLAAPMLLRWVARLAAQIVGCVVRVEPTVLADHTAGDSARAGGAVVAIGIGFAAFVALLIWGSSMLDLFVIDARIPRWMISIHPYGLERSECEHLLAAAPVANPHALVLVDTQLGAEATQRQAGLDQAPVPALVCGMDATRELGDAAAALPIRFVAGSRAPARDALLHGDGCLVSDWYAASHGLRPGDDMAVVAPGAADRHYRIAGVIDLHGWRMMTKMNKVRRNGEAHEVMIMLDAAVVRRDFPSAPWANYILGDEPGGGADAHFRTDLDGDAARVIAYRQRMRIEDAIATRVDLDRPVASRPDGEHAVAVDGRTAQADDLDSTRASLLGDWGGGAVRRMGLMPLTVLALALFAVAGTLVASLRARAREIGVLRACGLTRAGLVRLALGEAMLIGLAALVVGGGAGAIAAWLMLEITTILGYHLFTGVAPGYLVPWIWLWPGVALAGAVCVVAALWAAWRVGRTPPAHLVS